MRVSFVLLIISVVILKCATSSLQKTNQMEESFRVSKVGDTLIRVNIPLGEIEKFYVDLYAKKNLNDSVNFEINVFFTDTMNPKPLKLYFLTCKEIDQKHYIPTDTILYWTKNGKYIFNLSSKEVKTKKIIVFLDGWVGYLFE